MRALRVIRLGTGTVVLAGVMGVLSGGVGPNAGAQQPSGPVRLNNNNPPMGRINQPDADAQAQAADEQKVRTPATERQKKLAADTDKLLALAKELKEQVDKTNKDVLSVNVVKKAEEIEKLAKSVKTELKE